MEDDTTDVTTDVLEQLAGEHRSLTSRSQALCRDEGQDDLTSLATAIVEHELVHRLLEHPLLRRDVRGGLLFQERREEQLLLAARLVRILDHDLGDAVGARAGSQTDVRRGRHVRAGVQTGGRCDVHPSRRSDVRTDGRSDRRPSVGPIELFDAEFAAHTDREEILSFPHLRREVPAGEFRRLGALRQRLRPLCLAALEDDPDLVTQGLWATAPRHELPGLLGLPADLIEELPVVQSRRADPGAGEDRPDTAHAGRPRRRTLLAGRD